MGQPIPLIPTVLSPTVCIYALLPPRREVEQVLGREGVPLTHSEFQRLLAGLEPNDTSATQPAGRCVRQRCAFGVGHWLGSVRPACAALLAPQCMVWDNKPACLACPAAPWAGRVRKQAWCTRHWGGNSGQAGQ